MLTGCVSLAPTYERLEPPVPQQLSVSQNSLVHATDVHYDTGWREFFTDPQLQKILDEALINNKDLRSAALKVQEVRAQYRIAQSDRFPHLNASAHGNHGGQLEGRSNATHEYQAGLDLSFDIDFFGRFKNMSEADQQRYFASAEAQRSVHIMLIANVAQGYFKRYLAYTQLHVAQAQLHNYQQSYAFIEKQRQLGTANLLALEQARGQIERARSDIAKRQGELAQANHALQQLLGIYQPLPKLTQRHASINKLILPTPLSSEILLQRPDIMEAEHLLKASHADIGAARAAFFPTISLTGSLGSHSTELSSLFSSGSGIWSFMPSIDIPIFNAGRNRNNLELANIRQQQSIVNYEKKIQQAFTEVADALAWRHSLTLQISAQEQLLESLQLTLERAQSLYRYGVVSYIESLDAERALFSTQQALLDLNYAQQVNEITLFAALGGGWVK